MEKRRGPSTGPQIHRGCRKQYHQVKTDDRTLDETMAAEDGDVVLAPKGYHPCAACHGYDLYYLNVMADLKRARKFRNAREYEWLFNA